MSYKRNIYITNELNEYLKNVKPNELLNNNIFDISIYEEKYSICHYKDIDLLHIQFYNHTDIPIQKIIYSIKKYFNVINENQVVLSKIVIKLNSKIGVFKKFPLFLKELCEHIKCFNNVILIGSYNNFVLEDLDTTKEFLQVLNNPNFYVKSTLDIRKTKFSIFKKQLYPEDYSILLNHIKVYSKLYSILYDKQPILEFDINRPFELLGCEFKSHKYKYYKKFVYYKPDIDYINMEGSIPYSNNYTVFELNYSFKNIKNVLRYLLKYINEIKNIENPEKNNVLLYNIFFYEIIFMLHSDKYIYIINYIKLYFLKMMFNIIKRKNDSIKIFTLFNHYTKLNLKIVYNSPRMFKLLTSDLLYLIFIPFKTLDPITNIKLKYLHNYLNKLSVEISKDSKLKINILSNLYSAFINDFLKESEKGNIKYHFDFNHELFIYNYIYISLWLNIAKNSYYSELKTFFTYVGEHELKLIMNNILLFNDLLKEDDVKEIYILNKGNKIYQKRIIPDDLVSNVILNSLFYLKLKALFNYILKYYIIEYTKYITPTNYEHYELLLNIFKSLTQTDCYYLLVKLRKKNNIGLQNTFINIFNKFGKNISENNISWFC